MARKEIRPGDMRDKDMRKVAKALVDQGFELLRGSGGHVLVYLDGAWIATFSGTASDYRSNRNGIGACRRAGFVWRR